MLQPDCCRLYSYWEHDKLHPDVEDIPNSDVKQSLETLMYITDEAEFKTQAKFNSDFRFDAGYNKPFVCIEDKEELCRSVALHHVILASITEKNQHIEGLETTNMLDLIRHNPELFRKLLSWLMTSLRLNTAQSKVSRSVQPHPVFGGC